MTTRTLKIDNSSFYVDGEKSIATIPATFKIMAETYHAEQGKDLVEDITPVIIDFLDDQFTLTDEEKTSFETVIKEDLTSRIS